VTGGRARGLPVGEVVSFDDVDCRAGDTGAATMTERSYGRSVGRLAGHSPVSHWSVTTLAVFTLLNRSAYDGKPRHRLTSLTSHE